MVTLDEIPQKTYKVTNTEIIETGIDTELTKEVSDFERIMNDVVEFAMSKVDYKKDVEQFKTLIDAGVRLQNTLIISELNWAEFYSKENYFKSKENSNTETSTETLDTPEMRIIELMTKQYERKRNEKKLHDGFAGLSDEVIMSKANVTIEDIKEFALKYEGKDLPAYKPNQELILWLKCSGKWLNVAEATQ